MWLLPKPRLSRPLTYTAAPLPQCNQPLPLLLRVGSPLATEGLSEHFTDLMSADRGVHLIPQLSLIRGQGDPQRAAFTVPQPVTHRLAQEPQKPG